MVVECHAMLQRGNAWVTSRYKKMSSTGDIMYSIVKLHHRHSTEQNKNLPYPHRWTSLSKTFGSTTSRLSARLTILLYFQPRYPWQKIWSSNKRASRWSNRSRARSTGGLASNSHRKLPPTTSKHIRMTSHGLALYPEHLPSVFEPTH